MAAFFRPLLVAFGVGLTGMVLLASPAAAQSGCGANANGTDVRTYGSPQDALKVDATDQVTITASSAGAAFRHYDVKLEFAGVGWSVASGAVQGTSWSDVVEVDTYASKGVGIYKVVATSTLDGGGTCSAVAYVKVSGTSPLSTTAGRVAGGVAALGLVGTAIGGLHAARGAAAAGQVLFAEEPAGAKPDDDHGESLRDLNWTGRSSGVGSVSGSLCAPLVLTAIGLTLRAVMTDAANSLIATLGRIHR
jgi:hypothetical protein